MATTAGLTITQATPADEPAIAALLRTAALPTEDFAAHLAHFLVARRGDEVVGVVGAEIGGEEALLRSLAVTPGERGRGLGAVLLSGQDRAGGAWGVKRWWLLTTTAESYFASQGFQVASRNDAPAAIRATREFQELCPAAAVCMTRERKASEHA